MESLGLIVILFDFDRLTVYVFFYNNVFLKERVGMDNVELFCCVLYILYGNWLSVVMW